MADRARTTVCEVLVTLFVLLLLGKQGESYKLLCTTTSGSEGFRCGDDWTACLPLLSLCNGVADCKDGSDEKGCSGSSKALAAGKCYSDWVSRAPVYVTCYNPASTHCCTKTDPWGYSISVGVSCCTGRGTRTTTRSPSYSTSSRSTRVSRTYTTCSNLHSTVYCTNRYSRQCSSDGYGWIFCARTRHWDLTTYTSCDAHFGEDTVPCTDSRSTHCCNQGCCASSTYGGLSCSATHLPDMYLDYTHLSTDVCSDYFYVQPSCCPLADSASRHFTTGKTCCEGWSNPTYTVPTYTAPTFTYDYNSDDTSGSTSYSGGSTRVIFGVGGSVGLVVFLSIIVAGIRIARRARATPAVQTGRPGQGRCSGILVIARTRLICATGNPDPPTGPPEPPAYADVTGEAPPYTETAESQGESGDGGDLTPPPSYDQVLRMEGVVPVPQEVQPTGELPGGINDRDTAPLVDV